MEKIEERRNQKTPKQPKKKFNWRIFLATILFIIAGVLFAAGPIRTFLLSRLQSEQIQAASNLTVAEVKANEAEEAEKRTEITQIIDGMSTKDVLNQLYIFSKGDTEALARILLCTPSSIDRIRKGETTATPEFSKRIKEILSYTSIEGGDFEDLRQALDSEYSWYYYLFPDGTFSEDKMEDEYTTTINPNIETIGTYEE